MKRASKDRQLCIIFSRYPRPGAAKTRLIPRLGPEGAARLQRRMTERLVEEALALADSYNIAVEMALAEARATDMAAWFGQRLSWHEQIGADLGERMATAVAHGFTRGFQRVVLVGADCPAVNRHTLLGAFEALAEQELVLGPSRDGGYYLIGLCQPYPELFENVGWGSDQVLAQTLAAAQRLGLKPALLERLVDVDRPEDLAHLPSELVSGL